MSSAPPFPIRFRSVSKVRDPGPLVGVSGLTPSTETLAIGTLGGADLRDGGFFARDRSLQPLEPRDLVAVLDGGAYAMAQSSNYNSRRRAAEVLVEVARAWVIRRRETMADLMAAESV